MTTSPSTSIDVVAGRDVTVLDKIAEAYQLGGFANDAAARAGISVTTLRGWLQTGARAGRQLRDGSSTNSQLSDLELECVRLVAAVEAAETQGKLFLLQLSMGVARGGRDLEVVTEKLTDGAYLGQDDEGEAIYGTRREVTTRKETSQPDGAMIRWRLERRWPEEFGRTRVEVSGLDGGPIEVDLDPRDRLLGLLAAVRERREAADLAEAEVDMPALPGVEDADETRDDA